MPGESGMKQLCTTHRPLFPLIFDGINETTIGFEDG